MKIKRLIWDIETSPNVGLFWDAGYRKNIPYDNIIRERAIICIAYKWEGSKKTECLEWNDGCDKKLVEDFIEIANQSDEMVAHNGDKYDITFLTARALKHGMVVNPQIKTVDTLAIARKRFRLNSNRLDYIAEYLGHGNKIKTEFGLWKAITLDNCPKAMKKMVKYCKKDVDLLEAVWKKLQPYHNPKTHVGVMVGKDKWTCPDTGSENVHVNKTKITAAGTVRYEMYCRDSRRYYTISQKAYNDYREAKSR